MPTSHTNKFLYERKRLVRALGELTKGGLIEGIQHIGSTSLPGAPDNGCVDIGMCIWPYPLERPAAAKLVRLGYLHQGGVEESPERRYLHTSGEIQLLVTEAGGERWTDYLLTRDYLRADPDALANYLSSNRRSTSDTVSTARRWSIEQRGFTILEAAVRELDALPCPWHISSGWSIDLFIGRVTRVHHDIDVVIARDDQLIAQNYMIERGWRWVTPHDNQLRPWPVAMKLELPRHQAHCHRDGAMFDFLISEIKSGIWWFRRDLSVVRAMERVTLMSASGVPFMAPEVALLYKSKHAEDGLRPKDNADFLAMEGHLDPERRSWLRWALIATQPDHPWIEMLG